MIKPDYRTITTYPKVNGHRVPQEVQVVTLRKRGQNFFNSQLREQLIKTDPRLKS
jgi:uncharacterized pyridoxamine 5'-phosphate oxidase family protein